MISIITLIIEIIILSALGTEVEISYVTAGALVVIQTIVMTLEINFTPRLGVMRKPLMRGVLFRVFLLFFDLGGKAIYTLPNSGADSEMFYRNAVLYATTGVEGRGGFFGRTMGSIFSVIGTNRLYGQFIVVLFSIVSLLVLSRILSELDLSDHAKARAMNVAALLPNFAILSSIFLRESIVTMFLTISLYFFTRWMKRGNAINFLLAFLFPFAAALYHSGSAAVAVGYIGVLLFYDRKNNRIHTRFRNLLPGILLVLIVAYLFINYGDVLFSKMANVDSLDDIGNTSETGGSSYAQYVGNSNTPLNMAIFTIPRIIFFLFSPFPWQWRNLADIIAFVFSGMYYLYVTWISIRYIRSQRTENRPRIIAYLIIALAVTFVFAWGVSNVGTATRHRDKMVTLFAVLLALASEMPKKKRERRYYDYSVGHR